MTVQVGARGLKGERERVEQGRVEELECGQIGGAEQSGLVRQHDSLMCLLARRELR